MSIEARKAVHTNAFLVIRHKFNIEVEFGDHGRDFLGIGSKLLVLIQRLELSL